ncbi:MAG: hypothetical protein ACI35W_07175 [Anaeroplasmataceae bacterium]
MSKRDVVTDKSVSLFRKKKILIILLIIFLLLSATIGVVTFYGTSTGGFTISVPDDLSGIGISLYEKIDDPNGARQVLTGNLLANAQPIEMGSVNKYPIINSGGGRYESKAGDYIGYTFYLKNEGTEVCNIDATLNITSVTRNVDSAVRFWVFEGDDTEGIVYKKYEDPANETHYTFEKLHTVKTFTDMTIFTETIKTFKPGDVIKYSIIMWLDGEDLDCTDEGENSISGGSIKIGMSFSAYDEKII